MRRLQLGALSSSQQDCHLECVLDLPAVQVDGSKPVDLDVVNFGCVHLQCAYEILPDRAARLACEFEVRQGDVDARFEGCIDTIDAICCEEDNSLEVFEGLEKDCSRWSASVIFSRRLGAERQVLETSWFLCRSRIDRLSRKTSASSRIITAFHVVARSNASDRCFWTSDASVPNWPADIKASCSSGSSADQRSCRWRVISDVLSSCLQAQTRLSQR